MSEFDRAPTDLDGGKAPGIDIIPVEVTIASGKETVSGLLRIVCKMYETGKVAEDFGKIIIQILKKTCTYRCKQHRTIS